MVIFFLKQQDKQSVSWSRERWQKCSAAWCATQVVCPQRFFSPLWLSVKLIKPRWEQTAVKPRLPPSALIGSLSDCSVHSTDSNVCWDFSTKLYVGSRLELALTVWKVEFSHHRWLGCVSVVFLIVFPSLLQTIEANWRCGRHNLQRIQCRSENSKGVYCLQYDDDKIISGLRDNSIKVRVHVGHHGQQKLWSL